MSQKRQPDEEGEVEPSCSLPEEKRKRVSLQRAIKDVIRKNSMENFWREFEPLLRKVVKEEIESAFQSYLPMIPRQVETSSPTSRTLKLKFINKLSLPIYTGARVEGDDSLTLTIVEPLTGEVVSSGPLSMMIVEIVVLEGDFDGDKDGVWTFQQFNDNIVREREGKRSLLAGDTSVELREGKGTVVDLSFTDNSSWTRSRKFRLGVKTSDGYANGVRVKEAMTEPFYVKDHRGELYKKHHPPALHDEVWRIEKIAKDGAFHKRLTFANVNTVKDFLTLYHLNPPSLRNILAGMSDRMWAVVVQHAQTCTLPEQLFFYHANNEGKNDVVFNVVGKAVGVHIKEHFVEFNDLSALQKAEAEEMVKLAYHNWETVLPYEQGSFWGKASSPHSVSPFMQHNEDNGYLNPDFLPNHASILSPDFFSFEYDASSNASYDPCETFLHEDRTTDDLFKPCTPLHGLSSGSVHTTSKTGGLTSGHGRASRRWKILSFVLRWVFQIKGIIIST